MDQKDILNASPENLLTSFPVWEESVWTALQKKDYAEAADKLQDTLEYFTDEGLSQILWKSLLEGIPAVRGALSSDEWNSEVLPFLALAFINFADGRAIADTYQRTSLEIIKKFHPLVVDSIPGETPEEKVALLKTSASSTYIYLTASPAQIFGLGLFPIPQKLPSNEKKKPEYQLGFLSEILRYGIFSFDTAQDLFLIAQNRKLDEKKMSALAYATGSVLLGIIALDDFSTALKETIETSPEECDFIAKEIREKILEKHRREIKELFEGTKEATIPSGETVSLEVFGFDGEKAKEAAPVKITPEKTSAPETAPLVIHREKPSPFGFQNAGSKQSSGKSFSLPFGFFKSKSDNASPNPVRATIELPKILKPEEKKTIHYSELRTPITPFQKERAFISTDTEKGGKVDDQKKIPADIIQKKEDNALNLSLVDTKKDFQKERDRMKEVFSSIPAGPASSQKNIIKEDTRPTTILKKEDALINKSPEKISPSSNISSDTPLKKQVQADLKNVSAKTPQEKPQLTGKGFFWGFPKKKPAEAPAVKKPETGPEIEGNKLNLKK